MGSSAQGRGWFQKLVKSCGFFWAAINPMGNRGRPFWGLGLTQGTAGESMKSPQ